MELLFALLGGMLGTIGPAAGAAEPTLPLRLDLREIEPSPLILPEVDPHWPVFWLIELPEEDGLTETPIVFHWPEYSPAGDRLPPPTTEREPYFPSRLELAYDRYRKLDPPGMLYPNIAHAILHVPTSLLEALTTLIAPDGVIANERLVFDQVSATDDLATIMAKSLITAEMKFYGSLRRSELYKTGVQNGTEDFDSRRFNRLQYRALFNAMKNAYRERYRIPALDLDTVLSTVTTGDWLDVLIVPAAVSIYAAQFGFDRKIRLGENVKIELQIEKLMRWRKMITEEHTGRLMGFSLNLFKLPVSAIVTVYADKGGVGVEFVGIGTDINTAICTIFNHEASRDLRRER
jgi:hypothetical protein